MAVLVPERDDPRPARTPPRTAVAVVLDPLYVLAATTPVTVTLPGSAFEPPASVELPRHDPDELAELIETLYVLDGWPAVDQVVSALEQALVAAAFQLHPLPGVSRAVPRPGDRGSAAIHYAPVPADPVTAIGALIEAVAAYRRTPRVEAALRLVHRGPMVFSQDLPPARVPGPGALDPALGVRVFADALLAVSAARSTLCARIRAVLIRVERETNRLITTTLNDARTEVVREGMRYFRFEATGIESALGRLKTVPVRTDDGGLAAEPAALRGALHELEPYATRAVQIDNAPRGTPTPRAMVEAALARARAVLAKETGRRAQTFPVLSRIAETEIWPASTGDAATLGAIVWTILRRAYDANRSMRGATAAFRGVAEVPADASHPELALAAVIRDAGAGGSAWSHAKFAERAADRIVGDEDLGRRAVESLHAALDGDGTAVAEALALAAGEALLVGAAGLISRRLLPGINVALAAWHIAAAVQEYDKQHDEFYCTLDPRDAFVAAAPSATGLAFDIATEAVFAII